MKISGSGRFLIWLAKRNSGLRNYLGLEIRPKLAKRAEHWVNELSLRNIHFIFANATISFKKLVNTYPGPLVLVSILCPDPHFKKKHHKRRVVQKPLVESIVDCLVPGGQVFIQSDVLEVAADMRNCFEGNSGKLLHIDRIDPNMPCDEEGWLLSNPMGIRTEREIHAEFTGARIYRRMYQKRG
ncbi:tRNA (guanine-N(7)-)-methyltransferase-like [Dorcoceras hygrometricum]|uniref:tRNA (guanine(46)-N(7))-methyltransferase n=1 Tax=Dorcoceras hygrometricum TaxID=472368 RepID=A0A2Z7ARG5_9LAMI|nr:tRNA (guanine-N(7)-)-methyltransferase-like [Dorcoceras hygrometricum]